MSHYPPGGKEWHEEIVALVRQLRKTQTELDTELRNAIANIERNQPNAARDALREMRILGADAHTAASDIERLLLTFDRLMKNR
jgi:G:T/U-mismatch repair DNA glycosylase